MVTYNLKKVDSSDFQNPTIKCRRRLSVTQKEIIKNLKKIKLIKTSRRQRPIV